MKQAIQTDKDAPPIGPYSQGVVAMSPQLYISARGPLDPISGKLVDGTLTEQAERTFANIQAVVEAAGATMADVVKVTVYLADWKYFSEMNEVYARFFPEPYPARTPVQAPPMGGLIMADAIVTMPEGQNQP